jgi:hypothetical protein
MPLVGIATDGISAEYCGDPTKALPRKMPIPAFSPGHVGTAQSSQKFHCEPMLGAGVGLGNPSYLNPKNRTALASSKTNKIAVLSD